MLIEATFKPRENLIAAIEARGYAFAGTNNSSGQRPELWGQPRFHGLVGPLWNGDGIRYETTSEFPSRRQD